MEILFIILQLLILAFLLLHDNIQLGRFNDVQAVRSELKPNGILLMTLANTTPVVIALWLCLTHLGQPYPNSVRMYLVIAYSLITLGAMVSWYIPYAFGASPKMLTQYQNMYGNTLAFLPERKGFRPNTIHVAFHCVLVMVLVLAVLITQ